jgi:hypothetical protein
MMTQLKHLRKTYRQLRLIAGWTLIAAPLLIITVAYKLYSTILPTLSHYYFAEQPPGIVRTLFTGFLILVGGILIAYRGFDNHDNWIHNAAGLFAVGVAIFPKPCRQDDPYNQHCVEGLLSPLHFPSAILLFLSAVVAVVYCGGKEFKKLLKEHELRTLRLARIFSITLMSLGIALYAARDFLSANIQEFKIVVLLAELSGFFGFAIHWLAMTRVINRANRRIREERKFSISSGRAIAANLAPEAPPLAQPGHELAQPAVVGADEEVLFEIP